MAITDETLFIFIKALTILATGYILAYIPITVGKKKKG